MTDFNGRLEDNLGWDESEAFVNDPDNAKIPDRSRNEHVIGQKSYGLATLSDALTAAADLAASIGQANGICPLDGSALVDPIYLPSYVDDVLEYADLASFPVTGETGKIYVAQDTGKTYRWSGSVYIEISPSEVTSVNGYTGAVTLAKVDVGLGNVTDDAQLKAADLLTEVGVTGADDKVVSEQGIREAITAAVGAVGSGGIQWREKVASGAGADIVTFASTYTIGDDGLVVYADGVLLDKGVDYNETTSTTITLIGNFASKDTQIEGVYYGNVEVGGGVSLVTTVGDPGLDTSVVSEQGIREALNAKLTAALVTAVGDPGSDTNVPSEQAVREALNAKLTAALVTTVGDPGSDTNVPSEQAVREALNAKVTASLVTTVGATGLDTNVVSEQGIREALNTKPTASLVTAVGDPGSDANIPSEQAVREALNAKVTAALVTTVGVTGSDTNVVSEQGIREALDEKPTASLVTTVGVTGSDTNVPSEQGVREALNAKVTAALVTTVGVTGLDTNVVSEQGIREALDEKPTASLVTTVGVTGSDTNVPSEQGVREAIDSAVGGVGGGGIVWREAVSSGAGSDTVTFATAYTLTNDGLVVYGDGVLLKKGTDYNEATTTTITLIGDFASKAVEIDAINFSVV